MSRFVPRRKDEIEMRYDHGRTWPAVNIKVYNNIWDVKLPNPEMPGLTHEWLELHMKDDEVDMWFWETCNWELEYLIDWAKEIVGDSHAKFYQDGRSGGWLVYQSNPEYWGAVEFAKWRKICRVSRAVADGIWESALNNIWANVYEKVFPMGDLTVFPRNRTDKEALDEIALLLSAPEWPGASGMEDIAVIVEGTGRNIAQEDAPEWPSH